MYPICYKYEEFMKKVKAFYRYNPKRPYPSDMSDYRD
jgi:hypothetical protein